MYMVGLSRDDVWMADVDVSGELGQDLIGVGVHWSVGGLWKRRVRWVLLWLGWL
jgi:hypothetical protein